MTDEVKTLTQQEVQAIFAKMQLAYGKKFSEQWACVPLEALMEDWAERLGDYTGDADAIAYAMRHMKPAFPPTAMEFAELCEKFAQERLAQARKAAQEEYEQLMTPDGKEWVWVAVEGGMQPQLRDIGSGLPRAPVAKVVREKARALMEQRGKLQLLEVTW